MENWTGLLYALVWCPSLILYKVLLVLLCLSTPIPLLKTAWRLFNMSQAILFSAVR